jgi:hypothetical protein
VFEKGVSVPAEVLFFQNAAGAPLATTQAGREVFLPPGEYALAARRKGKLFTFASIKIATGRAAERQLELTEALPEPGAAGATSDGKGAPPDGKTPAAGAPGGPDANAKKDGKAGGAADAKKKPSDAMPEGEDDDPLAPE